jgi:hypothetical protein
MHLTFLIVLCLELLEILNKIYEGKHSCLSSNPRRKILHCSQQSMMVAVAELVFCGCCFTVFTLLFVGTLEKIS